MLPAHKANPPVSQALLEFTGQTSGNLIAVLHDGVVIGSAVFSESLR
jgi:two-component system, OmpR family, sensor histidine kinase TrcS